MKNLQTIITVSTVVFLTMAGALAHHLDSWVTETGYQLSGEAAQAELEEAANHAAQVDAGWTVVAVPQGRVPKQAASFVMFSPKVTTRWDENFLFIESNGLPAHNMMVGITAWQQQVPLPQKYVGDNAWRIPLHPVPAKEPQMVKGRFLRGAIAIAANGIPIFNPQNNRGEVSYEIGELDQWGGHCGRADDYHYHVAPLHLQKVLGKDKPVAYALDGYPIYGLTEPNGAVPKDLDALHGHDTAELGYHYHASEKYPYVIGGFHGEVTELDGQVDPQPRAQPVREALQALRGAKITGFESTSASSYKLSYNVNNDLRSVSYRINADATYTFDFDNGRDGKQQEIYTERKGGGSGKGQPIRPDGPPEKSARERPQAGPPEKGGRPTEFKERPEQPRSSNGTFLLSSPVVEDKAELPAEFTGDGAGITPPLAWKGAPAGTQGYALLMDHTDPQGMMKWYWTLYDIPASAAALAKDDRKTGKMGTGFKGQIGYEPPHSRGPGAKTYVITLYALSAPLGLNDPKSVNRESLLAAMKGKVLASSSLRVVYTSKGDGGGGADPPPPRPDGPPPQPTPYQPKPPGDRPGGGGKGKGKGGPPGIIKPSTSDTMKLNVYADNWFMLYVNGRLVAVDPIEFTPHNVVSVDFLPEYPMNIAVLVKDNADPKTGLEYGSSIGDGGFILQFGDDTVTDAKWKAKNFFHGPINGDTTNPQVKTDSLPDKWWAADFDDSAWAQAKEYTVEEVDPKQPYFDNDFKDAKFIWTDDLALDNTIIFRTRIEKPGWTPRWNTKPDLDVKGVDAGASGH